MAVNALSMQRTVRGEIRLTDPIADTILTLGVRMHNPLSYKEIAPLFGIARDDVNEICEPYKEFLRTAGEDGPWACLYGAVIASGSAATRHVGRRVVREQWAGLFS